VRRKEKANDLPSKKKTREQAVGLVSKENGEYLSIKIGRGNGSIPVKRKDERQ